MFTKRFYVTAAIVSFILAGFFFFFPPIYAYVAENNFFLSSDSSQPIKISNQLLQGSKIGEVPKRIRIPTLGIDLPVVSAKVVNGYWELSDTTASYGLGSGLPGEKGNTVIFAHARQGLFLPLKNIAINNLVIVNTQDQTYYYKVTDIKQVYPTNVAVIGPTQDETLTLFTCSGFMDTKRLIVVAKPYADFSPH